jgi:hypothetical protein
MSQLSIKLDSLLQEAKRAVQRSPRTKQRTTLDGQQPGGTHVDASPFGLFNNNCKTSKFSTGDENATGFSKAGTIGTCSSDSPAQQQQYSGDLAQQLAAATEQCSLKQQEVEVLQAQVQRLCAFVESTVASEAEADAGVSSCAERITHVSSIDNMQRSCINVCRSSSSCTVWVLHVRSSCHRSHIAVAEGNRRVT